MSQIMRVIIGLGYLLIVWTSRAPTWNHCHCSWESWRAWTICSEKCGGGIQNRSRRVWHDDNKECGGFDKCASSADGTEIRACSTACYNGGTLKQSDFANGTCDCPRGTKGLCCEQIVSCDPPSSIRHGYYTGDDFSYHQWVQYSCDEGYTMRGIGNANKTCTEHGYWSGNIPVCELVPSTEGTKTVGSTEHEPRLLPKSSYKVVPSTEGTPTVNHTEPEPRSLPKSSHKVNPSTEGTKTVNHTELEPRSLPKPSHKENNLDVTAIAVGVSVSIATVVLAMLAALIVCAHISKRQIEAIQSCTVMPSAINVVYNAAGQEIDSTKFEQKI